MQVVGEDTPTPYLLGKPPTGGGADRAACRLLRSRTTGARSLMRAPSLSARGRSTIAEGSATDRIPALGTGPRPWSGGHGRWPSGGWRPRAKNPDHIGIGLVPLAEEWTGAGGVRFDTTPPPIDEESNFTFDTISPGRRALLTTRRSFPTSEARPAHSQGVAGSISTLLRCSDRENSVKGGHENSARPVTERDARRPGARGRVRCRRSAVPAPGDAERCPRGPWRRPATARPPGRRVGRRRGNGSAEQRWVSRLANRSSWSGR